MWFFLACTVGPDLPSGWEAAEPLDDFSQGPCGDTGAVVLAASVEGEGVRLDAAPVWGRCEQELSGWWQEGGSGAEVLVQPVDMEPDTVAKCSCAYDLSMAVPTGATSLDVYQRGDRYGGDEPTVQGLGTVAVE